MIGIMNDSEFWNKLNFAILIVTTSLDVTISTKRYYRISNYIVQH